MSTTITELWVSLTMNRRKALFLATLVGVLGFMVVRNLASSGPRRAAAETGPNAAAANTSAAPASSSAMTTRTVFVPRSDHRLRNLFRLNDAVFPPPPQPEPSSTLPPNSPLEIADREGAEEDAAAQHALRVRDALARLRLSSTLLGDSPMAVIEQHGDRGASEKRFVRPGERIGPFTLVQVEPHRVVLESKGVFVELGSEGHER